MYLWKITAASAEFIMYMCGRLQEAAPGTFTRRIILAGTLMLNTNTNERIIHWPVLFKFGKRKHLESLRKDGSLYMRPQTCFSKMESDCVRGDQFEGTTHIHQPKCITQMTIEDSHGHTMVLFPGNFVEPLQVTTTDRPSYNVYCMFSVTEVVDSPLVDERNCKFGDSFVVVLRSATFIERVCAKAAESGFKCEYELVKYYNEKTHDGETGPFRKPSRFAYQNEFRFAISPGSTGAITLLVGSLLDITSEILPSARINELVKFGVK
jgi:hypothetical protein